MKTDFIQEEYLVNLDEFAILADRCGMKRIFGFLGKQKSEMNRDTFLLTLHQMILKGMLVIEEEGVQIMEPYRSLFEQIQQADQGITVDTDQDHNPMKCCYFAKNGRMVITEVSSTKEDTLRIYQIEKDSFSDLLKEEGYLSYGIQEVEYHKKEKRILTKLRLWDLSDESVVREIWFCLEESYCMIETGSRGQMARVEYDVKVLQRMIQEMLGGEPNDSSGLICAILK